MSFKKKGTSIANLFIVRLIAISLGMKLNDLPVGRAVTRSSLEREVKSRASQVRQCCQRLTTAATFLRKEQCCLGAMTWRWARKLITCFSVIQGVSYKEKFNFDLIKLNDKRNHTHKRTSASWEKTAQLSTLKIT